MNHNKYNKYNKYNVSLLGPCIAQINENHSPQDLKCL